MSSHRINLRWRSVLLGVAACAGFAIGSAPANAKVVAATATHGRLGVVPAFNAVTAHNAACGYLQNCSPLTYHGGSVQHGQRLYTIFWVPAGFSMPASFESDVNHWILNFGTLDYSPSSVFSVAQQYYDNSGPGGTAKFTADALSYGGTFTDTKPYPPAAKGTTTCSDTVNNTATAYCLSGSQESAEVSSFVNLHRLPKGQNVEYLLFTPKTVGSCFSAGDRNGGNCAYTGYCAYHTYINSGTPAGQIVWANEPWTYQVNGCDLQYMGLGAGYPSNSMADPEFSTLSHEIIETMTDVNLRAWFDASGNEIGDKCAYNYNGSAVATWTGLPNNGFGYWNQAAGGKQYLMQYEYSDRISNGTTTGCVGKVTEAQPSATISPASAIHNHPQTFKATVSAPSGGLAYIQWSFGDGTATVQGGPTIIHTYATAGTKTITAIVTDKHGNEKRVLKTVTVS